MLSVHAVNGKATNLRLKTAGYRRTICLLAKSNSFRNIAEIFNSTYHRKGTAAELAYGTIAGDIEQEGRLLLETKARAVQEILSSHGFAPSGLYPHDELPDKYRNCQCKMLTFTAEDLLRDIVPGWNGSKTELEQPELIGELKEPAYSEADTEAFRIRHTRRGARTELSEEDKTRVCTSFARWYNQKTTREIYGIIHTWQMEKTSQDVVYISIDAVFVDRQAKNRKKPGNKDQADGGTAGRNQNGDPTPAEETVRKISHMNIRIDVDGISYYITSTDTEEAFRELVAVILHNGLYSRFMVFFIDGEVSLAEHIKTYFSKWKYAVYLDWMHLEHKCYERLSMAITGKRVIDPRGEVEYYSVGSKKGQIKSQEHIALSRLYARALIRTLWTGNVDEAISYLANLDPKVVKNRAEVDRLSKYLENKREWITCYALRKMAGLKNSSNGVESQNQMLVAERQKNGNASWRPEGSSFLSSITALFSNNEDREWFYDGKISFKIAV